MSGASPEKDQTGSLPRAAIRFQSEYGRLLAADYPDLAEEWDGYLQVAIDTLHGSVYPIHGGGGRIGIGILLGNGEQGVQDGGPRLNFNPLGNKIRFSPDRYDLGIVLSNISKVIVNSHGHLQIHGETDSYTQIFAISPSGEVNMRMLPKSPVRE